MHCQIFKTVLEVVNPLLDLSVYQSVEYILNRLNSGKVTAAMFLDLSKALDRVELEVLLAELSRCGIRGPPPACKIISY